MKKGRPGPVKTLSGCIMILALLWLTVSTPFVYDAAQAQAETENHTGCEDTNPFSSTTEEKNESSSSSTSEYLHELLHVENAYTVVAVYFKCHPVDLYFAYHPELLSPPPEA